MSSMGLNNLCDDIKSSARSFKFPISMQPLKHLKYLTMIFWVDPNPIVPDIKLMVLSLVRITYFDFGNLPVLRGIFNGVTYQIDENFGHFDVVTGNSRQIAMYNNFRVGSFDVIIKALFR